MDKKVLLESLKGTGYQKLAESYLGELDQEEFNKQKAAGNVNTKHNIFEAKMYIENVIPEHFEQQKYESVVGDCKHVIEHLEVVIADRKHSGFAIDENEKEELEEGGWTDSDGNYHEYTNWNEKNKQHSSRRDSYDDKNTGMPHFGNGDAYRA